MNTLLYSVVGVVVVVLAQIFVAAVLEESSKIVEGGETESVQPSPSSQPPANPGSGTTN